MGQSGRRIVFQELFKQNDRRLLLPLSLKRHGVKKRESIKQGRRRSAIKELFNQP